MSCRRTRQARAFADAFVRIWDADPVRAELILRSRWGAKFPERVEGLIETMRARDLAEESA